MSQLPAAFQNKSVASAFKPYTEGDKRESLSDGIGSSYGTLHYKGKTWSLNYRGGNKIITRPDDGTAASYVDVIILRQARVKSKSYYEAWDPNASEGKRPICASLDGQRPDLDVQKPQATVCALCPRNEWKKNAEGRNGKDCADYKRLAVLLMPNVTKQLLGHPLTEPVFLRVPPASLTDLGAFGDMMDARGFPYFAFVTRISFDPNLPHPKMVFTEHQPLTDAEAPAILRLREEVLAKRITGEEAAGGQRPLLLNPQPAATAAPATATTIASVAQPATPAPQPTTPAPTPVTATVVEAGPNPSVLEGLAAMAGAQTQAQASTTTSPSEGLGLVEAMAEAAANPPDNVHREPEPRPVAMQTVADVGVTQADSALEDRLAALLPELA